MKLINYLLLAVCLMTVASCNYLDIVPDEKATEEDAFKNPKAVLRYLYSCYSEIPQRHPSGSLDLLTGDEVVTPWEHENFGKFVQGTYTPSNPIINYWHDLYRGLRQCYLLKENVGSVPGLSDDLKAQYTAEADFLIAYYHYILIRTYGPSILIKELFDINTLGDPSTFLSRSPYDECVEWVAGQFKDVAYRLPAVRTGDEYGRATSTAAMALRGRLLLYAASPQFNGGEKFRTLYNNFTNADGTQLISTTYSEQKWRDAAQACLEAINLAKDNGYNLYYATEGALNNTPEPKDLTQRTLRFTFIDKENTPEVIFADCRKETGNGIQGKSIPRWGSYCWGGLAITLRQIERFYTENGLPIDEDPKYPYATRFNITDVPAGNPNAEEETLVMNMQREPRFYAWVAFHNGYFEAMGKDADPKSNNAFAIKYLRGETGREETKHLVQFTKLSNQGLTSDNQQGTKSGYLNKKGASPASSVSSSGFTIAQYPWPVIRLAELYLNYAEACVECNNLDDAKIYLNLVRERAGIPTVEKSWEGIAALDQNKMRQIVRQERQIELYLENHNFYDIRRWGEAEILGEKPMGLSVEETDLKLFAQPKEVDVNRNFILAHYLMPLPISEINKNPNLVQNPGYSE